MVKRKTFGIFLLSIILCFIFFLFHEVWYDSAGDEDLDRRKIESVLDAHGPKSVRVDSRVVFDDLPRIEVNSLSFDETELPFLGKIQCHSKTRIISLVRLDGSRLNLKMKYFYSQDGKFIRAEYAKPESKVYEFAREEVEGFYQQMASRIEGLPQERPAVSVEAILAKFVRESNWKGLTRLNISYVRYSERPIGERNVFILNTWGVRDDFFPDQSAMVGRKSRHVIDRDGENLYSDNLL